MFALRFLTESMGKLKDATEIDEVVMLLKDWVKVTAGMYFIHDSGCF